MESTQILECTQVLDPYSTISNTLEAPVKVGKLTFGGTDHFIWNKENTIGRDSKCDIVIDNKAVSVEHAIIEADVNGGHFICDLGSTNKTKLGDVQLRPRVKYSINNGAFIRIANVSAVYHHLDLTEQPSKCSVKPIEIPGSPDKNDEPFDSIIAETQSKNEEQNDAEGSDGDLFGEASSVSSLFLKPTGLIDSSYEMSCLNLPTKIDGTRSSEENTSVVNDVKVTNKDLIDESTFCESDTSSFIPGSQQMFTPVKSIMNIYDANNEPIPAFKGEASSKGEINNGQWDDIDDSLSQISDQMNTIDSLVEQDCLKVMYTPPKRVPTGNKTHSVEENCTKDKGEYITHQQELEKIASNNDEQLEKSLVKYSSSSCENDVVKSDNILGSSKFGIHLPKSPIIAGIYDCDTQQFEMESSEACNNQSTISILNVRAQEEPNLFELETQPMNLPDKSHSNDEDNDTFDQVPRLSSIDSAVSSRKLEQPENCNLGLINVKSPTEPIADVSLSNLPTQVAEDPNNSVQVSDPSLCKVATVEDSNLNSAACLEKEPSTDEHHQLENEGSHIDVSNKPIQTTLQSNEQITSLSNSYSKNDNAIFDSIISDKRASNHMDDPTYNVFDLETQILTVSREGSGPNVHGVKAAGNISFSDVATQDASDQFSTSTNSKMLGASKDYDVGISDVSNHTSKEQLQTNTNFKFVGAPKDVSNLPLQATAKEQLSETIQNELGLSKDCDVSVSDLATQAGCEEDLPTIASSNSPGDMSVSDLATQVKPDQQLENNTAPNLCSATKACDASDSILKVFSKPKDVTSNLDHTKTDISDLATQGLCESILESVTSSKSQVSSGVCDMSVSDLATQSLAVPPVTTNSEVEVSDISVFDLETQIIPELVPNISASNSKLCITNENSEENVSISSTNAVSKTILKNDVVPSTSNSNVIVSHSVGISESTDSPLLAISVDKSTPMSEVLGEIETGDVSFADLPTQPRFQFKLPNYNDDQKMEDKIDPNTSSPLETKSNDESEDIYDVLTQLPVGKSCENKAAAMNEGLGKCNSSPQDKDKFVSISATSTDIENGSEVGKFVPNVKDSIDIYSIDTVPITSEVEDRVSSLYELNSSKKPPTSSVSENVSDQSCLEKEVEESSAKDEYIDVQPTQGDNTEKGSGTDENRTCQSMNNGTELGSNKDKNAIGHPCLLEEPESTTTASYSNTNDICTQSLETRIRALSDQNVNSQPLIKSFKSTNGSKTSVANLLETLEGSQSPCISVRKKPKPIVYSDSEDYDSPLLVAKKIRGPLPDYDDDSPSEMKDVPGYSSEALDNDEGINDRGKQQESTANTTLKEPLDALENIADLDEHHLLNDAVCSKEKTEKDTPDSFTPHANESHSSKKLDGFLEPDQVISKRKNLSRKIPSEKNKKTLSESKSSVDEVVEGNCKSKLSESNELEGRSFKLEISSERCSLAEEVDASTPDDILETINCERELSPELTVVRKSSDGLFPDKPLRQYTNTKRFSLSSFSPLKKPSASSTPATNKDSGAELDIEEASISKNDSNSSANKEINDETPKNAKKFKKTPKKPSTHKSIASVKDDITDSQECENSQELGRGKRKKVKKSFFDPIETSPSVKSSHRRATKSETSETMEPIVKRNSGSLDNLSTSKLSSGSSLSGVEITKLPHRNLQPEKSKSFQSSPRKSKVPVEKKVFPRTRSSTSLSQPNEDPKELEEQDSIGNDRVTYIIPFKCDAIESSSDSRKPKRKIGKSSGNSDKIEEPVEKKRKQRSKSRDESNGCTNSSTQQTTDPSSSPESLPSAIESEVVALDGSNVASKITTIPMEQSSSAKFTENTSSKVEITKTRKGQGNASLDLTKSDESIHKPDNVAMTSAPKVQMVEAPKRRGRARQPPPTMENTTQNTARTRRGKKNESNSGTISNVNDSNKQSRLTPQQREDTITPIPISGKLGRRRHISPLKLDSDHKENCLDRSEPSKFLSSSQKNKKGFTKQVIGTSQSFTSSQELGLRRNKKEAVHDGGENSTPSTDLKNDPQCLQPHVLVTRIQRRVVKSLEGNQDVQASQTTIDQSQLVDNSQERRSTRKRKKKETFDQTAARKEEEVKLKKVKDSESLSSESPPAKNKNSLSEMTCSSVPPKKRRLKRETTSTLTTSLDELNSNLSISIPSSSSATTLGPSSLSRASIDTPAQQTTVKQSQLTLTGEVKVMFTGLADPKLESMVKSLGGRIVERPQNCSVLVTDKVRRTVKFLCALGLGKPIVTPNWLSKCKAFGKYKDPGASLLKDEEAEKKFQFALADSLEKARSAKLFEALSFYVTPSVLPPPSEMKPIIKCSGGTFIANLPSKWPSNAFVISSLSDKSEWPKLTKHGVKPPILSAEAILSGVLQQNFDVNKYSLK